MQISKVHLKVFKAHRSCTITLWSVSSRLSVRNWHRFKISKMWMQCKVIFFLFSSVLPKNFILRLEVYADDTTLYLLNFVRQIFFSWLLTENKSCFSFTAKQPKHKRPLASFWRKRDPESRRWALTVPAAALCFIDLPLSSACIIRWAGEAEHQGNTR